MIECKESDEIQETTEEEYDYMNEESLEEEEYNADDEEPDYCD